MKRYTKVDLEKCPCFRNTIYEVLRDGIDGYYFGKNNNVVIVGNTLCMSQKFKKEFVNRVIEKNRNAAEELFGDRSLTEQEEEEVKYLLGVLEGG